MDSICSPLFKEKEYLCLVDGNGSYVYSSTPAEIATQTRNPVIQDILSSSLEPGVPLVLDTDSEDIVICSRILEDPVDWYLIKISPKAFVYEKASRFFHMMLYSFIIVTLAEILLIVITVIRFTAPIRKVTALSLIHISEPTRP